MLIHTPDPATASSRAEAERGRREHYAEFYGRPARSDVPLGVVFGNCQAESLRQTMPSSIAWVRMPPVHELTIDDLPYLERLLARVDVLISQPVRDGYHGMPLGTRQLFARVRSSSATAVMPVIRFAGLYPTQVIVRPPSDASLTPPLVPYHDLRTLAEAAGVPLPELTASATLAIAGLSLEQLRSRESRHGAIPVSDLFTAPEFAQMRTINHPGNVVWTELAARASERLGVEGGPTDVGRPLLDSVHAPRSQQVIDAWQLDDRTSGDWTVDGHPVSDPERHRVHLEWYRQHPDALAAGLDRHAGALRVLAAA